jgi:hypothetical protein
MEDGAYFRARARKVLAIADSIANPDTNRDLLEIAAEYERLAELADDRAARRPPSHEG